MAKESVLSTEEKESIEIEKLIFHIIIQENFNPEFLDEVIINPEQNKFFKNRLIDIAQGTQYLFIDKENNIVYDNVKKILDDPNSNFLTASKRLASSFKQLHTKNTNDGVFIVILAKILNKRKLVFLLKLDHKKVYEYKREKTKALLEEVKNTFVEDKAAIQKVALIDVTDHYIWDVLAYDRVKPSSLTEYFSKFLMVNPRETPTKLTEESIRQTHKWAVKNHDLLDSSQEISAYKNRAIAYLKVADCFDTDKFIDYVIYDENIERKKKLMESFNNYLIEVGIAGQSFIPNKNAINKKTQKNIRQTAEGVKIEWTGEASDNGIKIPQLKNKDGLYQIEILTSNILNLQ